MDRRRCTFTQTGKAYVMQPVYRCRTCNLVGNLGMCHACSVSCHPGHDTFYHHHGTFFCDCGDRGAPRCKRVSSDSEVATDSATMKQVFECPVCLAAMSAPIYLCANGHNVCADCKERMSECPLCRGALTGARNLGMESLGQALELACENCNERFLLTELNTHARCCPMNDYPCPLQPACAWKGKVWDVQAHCRQTHGEKILGGLEHTFRHTNLAKVGNAEANIIESGDNVFLFHRRYNHELSLFQGVVKCVGSTPGNGDPLYYRLTFASPHSDEKVVLKKMVRPVHEDVNEIYKLYNGAVLYMSQATSLVNLKSIEYTLKIEV